MRAGVMTSAERVRWNLPPAGSVLEPGTEGDVMGDPTCDVAVIGAGTAGLAAERAARKAGATTRLIDPEFAGTTCATVGCMPSKLLIAAADAAHGVGHAARFGIHTDARIDGRALFARLRRLRDDFAGGVRETIADLPEETRIRARAAFAGPGELELDSGARLTARSVVIATGSRPMIPPPFRDLGDLVLTNETVFDLEDLPESLGVIGGGPIGLELAQAFARLGVRVELYDAGSGLGGLPAETSAALADLIARDLPLHLEVEPEVRALEAGVEVRIPGHTARFERLLVATGRPPSLKALRLDRAGLETDDHGVPLHDIATMQCGDAPVFIAGDATAERPLLHEAADEGAIAGANAAAFPDIGKAPRKVPLAITFSRPSSAVIGTVPDPDDPDHATATVDFADQGRTRVEARPGGLLRLHADRSDGRLVGADLCAPEGEHLAHLLVWAISAGMTVNRMLDLPFYHPTVEEGLATVLRRLCGEIDAPVPWSRDEGPTPGA